MNWNDFKNKLQQYPEYVLQFLYGDTKRVNAAYHITEIKQAVITSVDCGGVLNNWTEVIVQLWEPDVLEDQQAEAMKVEKALSIIAIVENKLSLAANAVVKIEFGDATFDTRQMLLNSTILKNNDLIFDLRHDTVQCKAIERGGSCGTSTTESECCAPVKPKIQLITLTPLASCCTPGGGCC